MMRGEVQRGNEINCYCPVCQPTGESSDKRLYYKYENGKLLAHCKHGCTFAEIVKHFPKNDSYNDEQWIFLREHIYYSEDGSIFGKKVYYLVNGKKQPCWKRFENNEYITGLNGKKAGLYNVVDLVNNTTDMVWVVEGEKDVDTLKKYGLVAVSPPNGAGYWKATFNQYLKKRNIIIVPDNDEQGKKHLEKVAKNLVKVAKSVRLLDLTDLVPELKKGGDISDVFEELPNAKDLLLQLVTETEPEETRKQDVCFILNGDGKPIRTLDNFKILLQHHGINIHDNSALGLEFSGNLPQMTDENVLNITFTHLYSMSREVNINFTRSEISDYSIAVADSNFYNPVKDWLDTLDSDVKGYIREYFDCLIFDEEEVINKEIYLTFFGKWLIQCIAMQFNQIRKPIGADGALGLQSQNEGIGKTSFFKNLCFDPRYFKDSVNIDPTNKDSVMKATSFWICELGEIESTLNKELARLKAFITEEYDTYRIPYASALTTKPRRTSFCFTCNSQHFLKEGDNRRFWTIPIIDVDLKIMNSVDIRKVWAEAYALYLKNPESFRLNKKELAWLKDNNKEKFGFRINEEEVLRDKLNFYEEQSKWNYMTATDISAHLFDDKRHARAIGKILCERLGYTPKKEQKKKHFRILHGQKQYFVPIYTL